MELTGQNREIAVLRAKGEKLQDIGDRYGVSKVTICNKINRNEEIKNLIEKIQYEFYMDNLSKAKSNITELINKDAAEETKERDLQVKVSVRALESAGVLNTGTPNTYIQSIVNVGNDTIRGAYATRTIGEYTGSKVEDGEGIE